MADLIYLSLWWKQHQVMGFHRQMARLVRSFPFSPQSEQCYLRVSAVDSSEPALFEQTYVVAEQREEMLGAMERWTSADICFEIEGYWDLWQWGEEGWRLSPSRVNLFFHGPEYETDLGDAVRVELGLDLHFVPEVVEAGSARYYQSNIRSVLQLGIDWEQQTPVRERRLWSESGDPLEARLRKLAGELMENRQRLN
jgi:hypothetical protein